MNMKSVVPAFGFALLLSTGFAFAEEKPLLRKAAKPSRSGRFMARSTAGPF